MNAFYEHHKNSIEFGYRCFDRLLLNGLIQPFQQPERILGFFNTYRDGKRVIRRTLTEIAEIADQFHYWVTNRSEKWGAPIVEAPQQERRDDFVLPYLQRCQLDRLYQRVTDDLDVLLSAIRSGSQDRCLTIQREQNSRLVLYNGLSSPNLRCQALQTLRPADLHPSQVSGCIRNHSGAACLQSEFRLATLLREKHGCEPVEDGISFLVCRIVSKHKALGFHELAIYASTRILGAVGCAHHDSPGAANARVHLADRIGESLRPPPSRQMLWIGPRLEN